MEKYRKKDVISDKELSEFEHIEINKIKSSISNIGTSKINWRKYLPTALPVSLLSTLIIVITIAISGDLSQTPTDSDTTIIDINGPYGVVESVEKVPDFSKYDDADISFSYTDTYFSFQDLEDDVYAKFYYGKVTRIEENNIFVDSLYFDVTISENKEVLGEIRISVQKDQNRLSVGDEYVLYLIHNEKYSYYYLSNPYKSIFLIKGDEVQYSDAFEDLYQEIGNDKEGFLDKIFK